MRKKSQASLEYLTTYGWAFILVIVMIGGLTYFGITNPTKLFPNRCTFSSDVQCKDFVIAEDSLRLLLRNNVGDPITLTSIDLEVEETTLDCPDLEVIDSQGGSTPLIRDDPDLRWPSGTVISLRFTNCAGPAVGLIADRKEIVDVDIKYQIRDNIGFIHSAQGEVFGLIQN